MEQHGNTTLSERAHHIKSALESSGSSEVSLTTDEAFIGHEFKGLLDDRLDLSWQAKAE